MRYVRVLLPLVVMAVMPAYGSIILFNGVDVLPSPPATVVIGTGADDSTAYAFWESQTFTSSPIHVAIGADPGTWTCCTNLPLGVVPSDLTINSYLLYAQPETPDPGSNYRTYTGSVTFSPGENIVGVIISYGHLAGTDSTLGSPSTTYGTSLYYGLEHGDSVSISGNLETLNFKFNVIPGRIDEIRILTEIPEPADFLLIGSGLLALGLFFNSRRRRRSLRAQE